MATDHARRAQAARLKTERERRGWGVRRMARFLRDAVDDHQKPELPSFVTYVKRWESGDVEITDARYRAAYARVLDIPESDLFDRTSAPNSTSELNLDNAANREDEVRRRAALQVIAALSAGVAIPPGALETALSGIEDALGNPLDVAEWERLVADYDYRLNASPAGTLAGDLTTDIVALGNVLNRRLPPLQQAGLLRVSAALSGLLAIDFADANDQRSARIAWDTAIRAADASGDRRMQVWTRGKSAQFSFFARRSPFVVTDLAENARRIAAGAASAGLGNAYAALIYLAVREGDTAKTHALLAELSRTCERISDPETAQSVFKFRETQRLWSESYAYAHMGDERADASLSQARALYPANALPQRVNLSLIEAVSLVKGQDAKGGLQVAMNVLQGQTRASAGGNLLAGSVVDLLPPKARALPEAREIRALTMTV